MLTQRPIASAPIGTSGTSDFHIDLASGTFSLSLQGAGLLRTDIISEGSLILMVGPLHDQSNECGC